MTSMGTTSDMETFCLLAHLLSKCQSLTLLNLILFSSLFLLSCLLINLLFWLHPAGPAWGRHNPLFFFFFFKSPSLPTPPGPRGLPIIGSITLLTGGLAHHRLAAACHATRLMAFSLGYTRAITTCTAAVAREILNSSAFTDRPVNESAYGLMFNRSIGFAPYGVYWSTLRKIASAHLFCPKQLQASEHTRLKIADQLVQQTTVLLSEGRCRVRDVLKPAALNNMMSAVFGRTFDFESSNSELQELVEQGYALLGELNWADHLPFLAEFDLQRIKFRCSRIVPRVKKFVGEIIADHRGRQVDENESRDFVDVLLSLQGPDRLSDSDIISVLWEMIFRGTDTVGVLVEWILARLVMHPEVQSRVHDEVEKVVGGGAQVTESDVNQMVYLQAVVKEVLRLHPPGPLMSWSRMSIRDSVVDGYHVPAGTTAMVNMWAVMRDPRIWDDPLTFNPDRWSVEEGHDSMMMMAPFGSGRRSCPGKTLGMSSVHLWVATLVRNFQFHSTAGGVDLTEVLRLSSEMANPLMVRVQPRLSTII